MRRLLFLLPALLVLPLVLAACGGDGDDGAPTAPAGETPPGLALEVIAADTALDAACTLATSFWRKRSRAVAYDAEDRASALAAAVLAARMRVPLFPWSSGALPDDMQTLLKTPFREVRVEVPVRMDDGTIETFLGWRIQHNQARGPKKGGLRYHPEVDADEVRALAPFVVFSPAASRSPLRVPFRLVVRDRTVEPGERFEALWATGYPSARAHVTVERSGKVVEHFWTDPGATQQKRDVPAPEGAPELAGNSVYGLEEGHRQARPVGGLDVGQQRHVLLRDHEAVGVYKP